jgi:hypothetical protein
VLRRKLAAQIDTDDLPGQALAQHVRQLQQVDGQIRAIDARAAGANALASAKSLISGQRTRACRQPLASLQDSGQLSTSISVKTRRSSLPVALRGSSLMNTTSRGTL